jgi:hypothetical protein
MGKITVLIAERPSIDGNPRGQFDDVMFVQLARARFANLAMEAAEKSIQAPLLYLMMLLTFLWVLMQSSVHATQWCWACPFGHSRCYFPGAISTPIRITTWCSIS